MPNHWLVKTEPSSYSFDDLQRDGRAVWDGVANPLALKHLRAMRRRDLAFVYHTGTEKSIVGIAEIHSDPYPDPNEDDARLVVVELRPRERLTRPIPLSEVKAQTKLATWELARMPRLSVMPVEQWQWELIGKLSRQAIER